MRIHISSGLDFKRIAYLAPICCQTGLKRDEQSGLYSELSAQNLAFETSSLKAAFRGELVPQDPNDEPASALLERIRPQKPLVGAKRRRVARATEGA